MPRASRRRGRSAAAAILLTLWMAAAAPAGFTNPIAPSCLPVSAAKTL